MRANDEAPTPWAAHDYNGASSASSAEVRFRVDSALRVPAGPIADHAPIEVASAGMPRLPADRQHTWTDPAHGLGGDDIVVGRDPHPPAATPAQPKEKPR